MREKKYEEIVAFYKEHNVNFISIRNIHLLEKQESKFLFFVQSVGQDLM